MPQTQISLFRKASGDIPIISWLDELETKEPKAFGKCLQRILALESRGSELRRPHADVLRDGIYELRARHQNVNCRMLYFFHGSNAAVLSHGLKKSKKVPPNEIDKAVRNKKLVGKNPSKHLAEWVIEED